MTYKEKLKNPKWQKKRLEILQRDEFKCRNCNSEDKTLHIHHLDYDKCDPWQYENRLLITLCEDCHQNEEVMKNFTASSLEYLTTLGFLRTDIAKIIMHISNKVDPMSDVDAYAYFKKLTNTFVNGGK